MSEALSLKEVNRTYGRGAISVTALGGVSFSIAQGSMVAIMGPSGSGKSTLLNILGCLDRPTSGSYFLAGEDVARKNDRQLADIRAHHIGFIFQNYNLLPQLTAYENVELPLIYRGLPGRARREAAHKALSEVGLEDRMTHRPNQLSGGQQQRVGIARALAGNPDIFLADEPTGNLDSKSGLEVLGLFETLHEAGHTLLIVTHDEEIAFHCERILHLRDGQILWDRPVPAEKRRSAKRDLVALGGDGS